MAKTQQERLLEKQLKQAKDAQRKQEREARKAATRDRAASIVNGQPIVEGLRILDETAEEALRCLLLCERSEENRISFTDEIFPRYIQMSSTIELEKLVQYGMLGGLISYDNGGFCYLLPPAITYFENKERALANDLKTSLDKLGVSVFYDKDTLEWGDNWKDKILEGVEKAEFAIIVISENFFGREWTEIELTEFLSRQNRNGQKIILPILHGISVAQIQEKYPAVAEIQALDSSKYSCDEIALKFAGQLIKRLKA